jgi:hypothetical protein
VASIVSDIRNPHSNAFYQSSKLANKVFANNIYYPRSLNLNYMIIKPGWVSTNLTKNRKVNALTASQSEEAEAIVKSIGFTRETYAQVKHLMLIMALNIVPEWLYW